MIGKLTRRMLGTAAAAVDRFATAAVSVHAARLGNRAPAEHAERIRKLTVIAESARAIDLDTFFPEPCVARATEREVRKEPNGLFVSDLSWESGYACHDERMASRFDAYAENRAAVCRRFARAGKQRPVAILVHGYMAGSFAVEERLWPLALFDRIGYDAVCFTLPFHGLRARPGGGGVPVFPGGDPRLNLEGFRQAVTDLRSLILMFHEQGHERVGLVGMSLGGYTAALTATLEASLDFVVPLIPLASLADFAREQGSLSPAPDEAAVEHALLEDIYRPISPFTRPSLVPPGRSLVIAAKADRVTPVDHARRLAAQLGAPLHSFYGGHLLQFGRSQAFERVAELLTAERP